MPVETRGRKGEVAKSGPGMSFRQTLSSLQYRDFRRLWLGQFGASGSLWMEYVTRGWLVYQMTESAFLLGLVGAVRSGPMLLFGIFGGVLADRLDRRKLLIASQVSSMSLNLILATLILAGVVQVWHVFAIALLDGVVMSFQQPARQAMISNLVEERDLMNAFALNAAATNTSRSFGPALAGVLVGTVGMAGAYYVQAALLLWASSLTYSIKLAPTAGPSRKSSMFYDIKEGLAYVRSNDTILALLILALVPMILGTPYTTMMPVFAKDVLNIGPEGLGILLSAPGIGAFVGATLLASLRDFQKRGLLLLVGAGLFGFTLVLFSFSTWTVVSLILLLAVGVAQSTYMATNHTLLQALTPDEFRGRVVSLWLLDRGLGPLGTTMAGALTAIMGASIAMGLMAGACCLLAIGMGIVKPSLRRLA